MVSSFLPFRPLDGFALYMPSAWAKQSFEPTKHATPVKSKRIERRPFNLLAFLSLGISAAALAASGSGSTSPTTGSSNSAEIFSKGMIIGSENTYAMKRLLPSTWAQSTLTLPLVNRSHTSFEPPINRYGTALTFLQSVSTPPQIKLLFKPTHDQRTRLERIAIGLTGIGDFLAYEGEEHEIVLEAGSAGRSLTFFLQPSGTLVMYRENQKFDFDSLNVISLPVNPDLMEIKRIASNYLDVAVRRMAYEVTI